MSRKSSKGLTLFPIGVIVSVLLLSISCTTSPQSAISETGSTTVAGTSITAVDAVGEAVPTQATAAPSPTLIPPVQPTPTGDTALPAANFELSNYTLHSRDTIALEGVGFTPGEAVKAVLNSDPVIELGELAAGTQGQVQVQSLALPSLSEGLHAIRLTGATSGRTVERQFSIIGFHPWVVLDSYALHAGEGFGFSGHDFAPGESVTVFLDSQTDPPMATFLADTQGNIRVESLIVATAKQVGKHILRFVAKETAPSLPVGFEVLAFVPTFELSSYAGPPGSVLSFSGRGFAPGEVVRAFLQIDNERRDLGSFTADSSGSFVSAGSAPIPADSKVGRITIQLEGEESNLPVSQSFGVLPLAAWAGLTSYSGPTGTTISFLGNGFASNESVAVYLGSAQGNPQVKEVTANERGEFRSDPFAIPSDATGTLTFTFHGLSSQGQAATQFTVSGG